MGLEQDKTAFARFEQDLRDCLNHLYDPIYAPADRFWQVIVRGKSASPNYRAWLIQFIENLRPDAGIPAASRLHRLYELLHFRYVQQWDQDRTAAKMGISPRHVRREQQWAVHTLAQMLWQQTDSQGTQIEEVSPKTDSNSTGPEENPLSQRSQIQQEIAALGKNAPDVIANIKEAIDFVVGLEGVLTGEHRVRIKLTAIPKDVYIRAHPSALRQALITCAEGLIPHLQPGGEITFSAERARDQIRIVLIGSLAKDQGPFENKRAEEILNILGGEFEYQIGAKQLTFVVKFPLIDKITVLVVDDNEDLVHFYRRYTTNTRYQIVPVTNGRNAVEAAQAVSPQLIVLDIMLPDIDGWQVLTQLRKHPATQTIPIVVCSVVGRSEMAIALGATLYVPKPVSRRQFILALDSALHPIDDKTLRTGKQNPATG